MRTGDPRRQAGVADELARVREAGDVADLRWEGQAEQVIDARDRAERYDARVSLGELTQLALERRDTPVEQVNDLKRF